MMFLLTCDKKLTKSQLSPTHASTKRKILMPSVSSDIDGFGEFGEYTR